MATSLRESGRCIRPTTCSPANGLLPIPKRCGLISRFRSSSVGGNSNTDGRGPNYVSGVTRIVVLTESLDRRVDQALQVVLDDGCVGGVGAEVVFGVADEVATVRVV